MQFLISRKGAERQILHINLLCSKGAQYKLFCTTWHPSLITTRHTYLWVRRIQVRVARFQLFPCRTIVTALGTAAAGKAVQSTRSTLRTLDLDAINLLLTAALSPPASEPLCCCSARPLRYYPPSATRRSALANPCTHRCAVVRAVCSLK